MQCAHCASPRVFDARREVVVGLITGPQRVRRSDFYADYPLRRGGVGMKFPGLRVLSMCAQGRVAQQQLRRGVEVECERVRIQQPACWLHV